ncbi:MAG: 1-phosphofructokinase [Erysipelotrichaceae bacterium]|jgi:1-phosphofructokinase|nr:1-phosphofructokinase [Erysipelotrichaceae bacterium]
MIYTITLNPSLDYHVYLDELESGTLNIAKQTVLLAGGKGINVSTMLTNLKHKTVALGFLAGKIGKKVTELLDEMHVCHDFIFLKEGETRINVKVHAKQETEINGNGLAVTAADLDQLIAKISLLKKDDFVIFSGSIPGGMNSATYQDILERILDLQALVIVDARGELLLKCLPYKPFLIKPNRLELGELFHNSLQSEMDIVSCALSLQEQGARNVLVSLGADGAFLLAENKGQYWLKAPPGQRVNSIGSGDAMIAGFLSGFLETKGDYEYALKKAVYTGSASAFVRGLASKSEVEQLIRAMDR